MQRVKLIFRPLYAPFVRLMRNHAAVAAERRRIRQAVAQALANDAPLKVIVGAGDKHQRGWINSDLPAFDVLEARHWRSLFPPHSIERLLAEHVFEHLSAAQFAQFLQLAPRYLAPGARIRIAVPDGNHPDQDYIERVRPGGSGIGAHDHKLLYTKSLARQLLEAAGYRYEFLEYFDEAGLFHQRQWQAADGFVSRSAAHDRRNAGGKLNYTSLIFDCWR